MTIIEQAVSQYGPSGVYCLLSGGDDSMAAALTVCDHPAFKGCVHLDTGIGVWDTDDRKSIARRHVEHVCKDRGWPLFVFEAAQNTNGKGDPDPQVYKDIVLSHGFPGSNEIGHRNMFNRLKERPLRMFMRSTNGNVLLVAGCRSSESTRRMGNTKTIDKQGRQIWCNPLKEWTKADCLDCINRAGIPRNPCSETICKSGECMCGAFAYPGELDEVALFYPDFAAWLRDLERQVFERHPWGWEGSPPMWYLDQKKGQSHLFEMSPTYEQYLCRGCKNKFEASLEAKP